MWFFNRCELYKEVDKRVIFATIIIYFIMGNVILILLIYNFSNNFFSILNIYFLSLNIIFFFIIFTPSMKLNAGQSFTALVSLYLLSFFITLTSYLVYMLVYSHWTIIIFYLLIQISLLFIFLPNIYYLFLELKLEEFEKTKASNSELLRGINRIREIKEKLDSMKKNEPTPILSFYLSAFPIIIGILNIFRKINFIEAFIKIEWALLIISLIFLINEFINRSITLKEKRYRLLIYFIISFFIIYTIYFSFMELITSGKLISTIYFFLINVILIGLEFLFNLYKNKNYHNSVRIFFLITSITCIICSIYAFSLELNNNFIYIFSFSILLCGISFINYSVAIFKIKNYNISINNKDENKKIVNNLNK